MEAHQFESFKSKHPAKLATLMLRQLLSSWSIVHTLSNSDLTIRRATQEMDFANNLCGLIQYAHFEWPNNAARCVQESSL